MPCYKPIDAFKPAEGPITFHETKGSRAIQIKCGQCIGCRLEKRDAWALRCMLESKMHASSIFATLTYDDVHLPEHGSLHYPHVQSLVRALRRRGFSFRYFVCGEYGDTLGRAHYHLLGFGLDFPDKVRCNSIRSSEPIYRSPLLEQLWPHGFSSFGSVSWQSARYCAGYTLKKVNGSRADAHYSRLDESTGEISTISPEFARMSLKPGIGASWLAKYWRDIYLTEHDSIIVNGSRKRVPQYFHRLMDTLPSVQKTLMDDYEFRQFQKAMDRSEDNTPERLAVREQCELARVKFDAER